MTGMQRRRVSILTAISLVAALAPMTLVPAALADPTDVFINEIHYDNTGADTGEAIEVAGPAGTDLTGWSIVLYNGSGGAVYDTAALSGVIPDQDSGYGTISVAISGIQNGAPDGMALVAPGDVVVQFLSYEGTFTAVGGPADGMLSEDIGVDQEGGAPVGTSLQLTGTGTGYADFTWSAGVAETFGLVNTGQSFGTPPPPDVFFNEIHYDNTGGDVGEAIEVAGPAGTDLTGWSIVLYNGSGGAPYNTTALSGVIPDQDSGYGTVFVSYPVNGIQNGAPDGMALVAPGDVVVQFLSYEGTFTAVGGPADGMLSEDIGAFQNGSGPVGTSLQLTGTGTTYADFTWSVDVAETFGLVNTGQSFGTPPPPGPADVWFNEIHYDNTGTDSGEAIEVAGPAGTDLTGWSIVLYNGANGQTYNTTALSGVIPDQDSGYGTVFVSYPVNGIQNGAPDGMALVAPGDVVVQFLSYEGTFEATNGPASGMTSTDIGVSQAGSEPVGSSLQLIGNGSTYADFAWTTDSIPETFGLINTGQSFGAPPPADVWFNEIHYDNTGTDSGEAIEVAGPAGTDLTGWSIVLYNGANGQTYNTTALSGVIPDQDDGFGTLFVSYPSNGIQNGAPDGMALVAPGDVVVQFLSYEGAFEATNGPASGMTSTDIGVSQTGTEPVGSSLQLIGLGTTYADFTWTTDSIPETFGAPNAGQSFGACISPPLVAPISQIQGSGDVSPCIGEEVVIEGVVVGDYEGPSPNLRGFYVQSSDDDWDDDPMTSEGIFVFNFDNDDVDLGDLVQVTSVVAEFQGQTQLNFPSSIVVVETGHTVTLTDVMLPYTSADYLERYEGMLVRFPQPLYVTEFFQLGRFGQVVVSSGGRLAQPTNVVDPGPDANALQAANNLNRLIIDDDLNNQNPDPIYFGRGGNELTASNTLRGGDTVTGAVGVMTYGWAGNSASPNNYRLRVVGDLSDSGLVDGGVVPVFEAVNERPTAAPVVGGSVEVASFNVLNYFLTLDSPFGAINCGPTGHMQACRGANSSLEFERQRVKLIQALIKLDADIVGMMEMENTTGVEPMADIVSGLNDLLGAGTYDYVDTGTIGTDVIKVGIIYKPDTVSELGDYAILDGSVDARYDDDLNRPALAQTFVEDETGQVFTVVMNHFKSKGCGGSSGLNADQGDGQGCWNLARTEAAQAMVDWLATYPTGIEDDDVLVMGDLNSYAKEDPIGVFLDAGFVNLVEWFGGPSAYGYVFDGQWGYLDHALASPSMFSQVTGSAEYHINSDEPSVLDYNTDFKTANHVNILFAPNEFRTSDHDPVLVGLEMEFDFVVMASPDMLWPPNHTYRSVTVAASSGGDPLAVEILDATSSEADSGLGEDDLPNDIVITGTDTIDLRAERYSHGGRTYTITVLVSGGGQAALATVLVYVPHNMGRGTGGPF